MIKIYVGLSEMLEAIEQREIELRALDKHIATKLTQTGSSDQLLESKYAKLDKELSALKHDFVLLAISEFEVHL